MVFRRVLVVFFMAVTLLSLTGCGSNSVSFDEKMQIEYENNNRLDRYYELQKRYDNSRAVLYLNQEDDCWWITNWTLWIVSLVFPDLPTTVATGGVLGIFYGLAWCLGITLTGGGILAVLAMIGGFFGGVPGIPPSIVGIIYLCIMFGFISSLVSALF